MGSQQGADGHGVHIAQSLEGVGAPGVWLPPIAASASGLAALCLVLGDLLRTRSASGCCCCCPSCCCWGGCCCCFLAGRAPLLLVAAVASPGPTPLLLVLVSGSAGLASAQPHSGCSVEAMPFGAFLEKLNEGKHHVWHIS